MALTFIWQLSRSKYCFLMLIVVWQKGESGWEVESWKQKTNRLCRPKKAGNNLDWMPREQMIYHERTQIRAKVGFHVSIDMYDVHEMQLLVWFGYWIWHISRTLAVTVGWFGKRKMTPLMHAIMHVTVAQQSTVVLVQRNTKTTDIGEPPSNIWEENEVWTYERMNIFTFFNLEFISPLTHNAQRHVCFSSVWFVSQQATCYRVDDLCSALHPEWWEHDIWDICSLKI